MILPPHADRDASGRLRIGGCAVADVVAELGTPVMIFDELGLREAAHEYLSAFRSRHAATDVYFASKALPCPAVAGLFAQEGLGCDVASAGELAFALAGGVPPERILLHGNAKRDVDIQAALDAGVGLIVVDSLEELDRLERLVTREQAVLVRVNPGVSAPTHEAMATGHDGSKFGVPGAELAAALARVEDIGLLRLEGVHVHIGSQILELPPFSEAVAGVARIGTFNTYDLGGGLGVRYHPDEPEPPSVDAYAEALVAAVHEHLGTDCRLIVEPGRSLVARAALTAYRVVTVKRGGPRTFVAIDGGMGDNLEPMLYDTRFAPFVLDADRPAEVCDIVGPHCETGDRLVADAALASPARDDVIVVPVTGAYCASLANNYNGQPRPPMVMCAEGSTRLVARRETFDDLLARFSV
jgi:diaminopimelate decarboxylase